MTRAYFPNNVQQQTISLLLESNGQKICIHKDSDDNTNDNDDNDDDDSYDVKKNCYSKPKPLKS